MRPPNKQPVRPPFSRRGTSEEAADQIDAASWRIKIARRVRGFHLYGMTCDEVEEKMQLSHQNASARLNELESTKPTKRIKQLRANGVARQLFTVDTDEYDYRLQRETRSGRKALVYFHLDFYEEVLRHYRITKKPVLH